MQAGGDHHRIARREDIRLLARCEPPVTVCQVGKGDHRQEAVGIGSQPAVLQVYAAEGPGLETEHFRAVESALKVSLPAVQVEGVRVQAAGRGWKHK